MSATRYRRFLKLCEEWPKQGTSKSRDLGSFLRQRVAAAFREGENTQFPRVKDTSFTGVTLEEYTLQTLLCVQQMDEQKKGLWKSLMERFSKAPEDVPEKAPEK
uniref:Mitochondrial nucleoid factor 1 n=1 Tax=Cynoglossus semilaevis TaxID=244447 RepID=A0A3P8UPG3_CYNSE